MFFPLLPSPPRSSLQPLPLPVRLGEADYVGLVLRPPAPLAATVVSAKVVSGERGGGTPKHAIGWLASVELLRGR